MNQIDYTIAVLEIIPLERLGLDPIDEQINRILSALGQSGFAIVPQSDNSQTIKQLCIQDKNKVTALAKKVFPTEDEMVWLVTDFFDHIFFVHTKYDLLLGLASANDPDQNGPFGRPPSYILSEVGDYTYRPTIARILISGALTQFGFNELGKALECISSYPRETALGCHIIFTEPPITYDLSVRVEDMDNYIFQSMSLLSSKLLTNGIVELLKNEEAISKIEIAKVFPFQFFDFDFSRKREEAPPFVLLNHFSIRARRGAFAEIIDELLGISLHINWSYAKDSTVLTRSQLLKYAMAQNARLRQVEEKEQHLRYALGILQKRHPSHVEFIEWEVNNFYSNLIRFSPIYLSWKSHLQTYINGVDVLGHGFVNLISQLDWDLLSTNGIALGTDGQHIVESLKNDPTNTLRIMRTIIEKIVNILCQSNLSTNSQSLSLSQKLDKLNGSKIIPPFIFIYLNALRLAGNLGVHERVGLREDVEAVLPVFLRVVEWFVSDKLYDVRS